tara:strand:+ start:653 stop:841 length:189 start_codon:yes stop_codon:yes gene_type:complete
MINLNQYKEIVIELSNRLADDSDYDSNIKPKCQALLDYLNGYDLDYTGGDSALSPDDIEEGA